MLVRDPAKAKVFKEKFGIEALVGSHSDEALLEKEVKNADYVIHTVRFSYVCCVILVIDRGRVYSGRFGQFRCGQGDSSRIEESQGEDRQGRDLYTHCKHYFSHSCNVADAKW